MATSELRASDKEQLEAFVDGHGLTTVCEMLAEICEDKAEHLRVNWQDEPTARMWERDAKRLRKGNWPGFGDRAVRS